MIRKVIISIILVLAVSYGQTLYKGEGQIRTTPKLLNYQGYLTDTLGNPTTNPSLSMTFTIFDAASAGNQKWTENQNVSVDKGIFHVLLGNITPIPDSVFTVSTNRWLALTISGQSLTPRTRIVTSSYAYTATYSDTAQYARSGGADNNWVRSGYKLYTYNLADSVGIGTSAPQYPLDVKGVICGGVCDTVANPYGAILGGYGNWTYGDSGTTVVGGIYNGAAGRHSFIGGGKYNTLFSSASVICGGDSNTISMGQWANTIGGGSWNLIDRDEINPSYVTISGGWQNTARGIGSTIGGGHMNNTRGYCTTIGGGIDNNVSGYYTTVNGGIQNTATGWTSAVSGGLGNTATGNYSTVGGGFGNSAEEDTANTVSGGYSNIIWGHYSTIGGGQDNNARGYYNGVFSGFGNFAGDTGTIATIVAGGWNNSTTGNYTFIGGGFRNQIAGNYSAILGGYADTITTVGNYAYLFGIQSKLTQDSTFMVDMPHIHFGKEVTGYEFPTTDGSSGMALTTNGSGILSWGWCAGTPDNDWIISGSDMYSGVSGNVGIGTMNPLVKFDVNGIICGGTGDTVNAVYGGVISGYSNLAGDNSIDTATTVAGGWNNSALGKYAFMGGGRANQAGGNYSAILGGYADTITASGNYSYLFGIQSKLTQDSTFMVDIPHIWYGTEASGYEFPRTRGTNGQVMVLNGSGQLSWGSVASDTDWRISGTNMYSGVSGNVGIGTIDPLVKLDVNGIICGGVADTVKAVYGGVFSGYSNLAGDQITDTAATVVGGWNNSALDICAYVGGGYGNIASGTYATIGGGNINSTNSRFATVAGGYGNTASGPVATVAGGQGNTASNFFATVAGGFFDTVAAQSGFATNYSTSVLAGHDNSAAFTTSHTTNANQVRAATFSTGILCFTMDHPDNPMKEILNQYSVGSDNPVLIYNGTAYIAENGRVEVNLPDYFDKINRNPRIQLTGVGTYEVFIAEDVKGNTFAIGGKAGTKVYWTVTAERKDINAEIARIQTPVEQPKTGELINHSLDDDALIGIYDDLNAKKPGIFAFKTEEGRRVHEQSKKMVEEKK